MKRQVLITTTLLLSLSGGLASESIASSLLLSNASSTDVQTLSEESATPSLLKSGADLKQNAERDRQRQQEAARREQERQRQAEMQERWQEDRDDDDDDDDDDDRRRDRWEDSEDYWDRDSQQDRDRERWEDERGDRDWEQQQNSRYWEDQRRTWENQQRDWEQQREWEQRRDWEFRREWWRNNGQQDRNDWQSQNPDVEHVSNGTRLDLTSLSDDWVTVLIESIDGEQALSFTDSNPQQVVYLTPGAYRLRFRPTLSSQPWRSGYLNVEETESIRLVFDQDRDLVQVYDNPSAWVAE